MEAKKKVISRFMKLMGLFHRSATHTTPKNFQETKDKSTNFIALMKAKFTSVDPEDILNMDQTPIPFLYQSTRTLEKKGWKTIHVHSLTMDTKQVTLAVAVEASRRMLPHMLIFKGAPNGQ